MTTDNTVTLSDEEIAELRAESRHSCTAVECGPAIFDHIIARRYLATIADLERQLVEARALLSPVSPDETLIGAIRNLQQAHLSEKGNADTLERQLAERDQQLQKAQRLVQHFDSCKTECDICPDGLFFYNDLTDALAERTKP